MIEDKLPAEIALINTEKADFTIPDINAKAWYLQNLSARAFSFKSFMVYGLMDQPDQTDTQENNSLKEVKVFFEIVLTDTGAVISENIFFKQLRYIRALEATVHKNFDRVRSGLKIRVDSLAPEAFELKGKIHRRSGISITANMSAN